MGKQWKTGDRFTIKDDLGTRTGTILKPNSPKGDRGVVKFDGSRKQSRLDTNGTNVLPTTRHSDARGKDPATTKKGAGQGVDSQPRDAEGKWT